ncbi:hypothetical protein GIB67_008847 [Kingdonia uniflora]|uniref:Uncharacterized protein n=1 Tax=Kingdonia uniflora TaxID=39325 RepID=A0A7J7LV64_9MAGN|nr:hypothetical protein GIB67_008847 [Kingdonia uniflora]
MTVLPINGVELAQTDMHTLDEEGNLKAVCIDLVGIGNNNFVAIDLKDPSCPLVPITSGWKEGHDQSVESYATAFIHRNILWNEIDARYPSYDHEKYGPKGQAKAPSSTPAKANNASKQNPDIDVASEVSGDTHVSANTVAEKFGRTMPPDVPLNSSRKISSEPYSDSRGISSSTIVKGGPHMISFRPQAHKVPLQASTTVTDGCYLFISNMHLEPNFNHRMRSLKNFSKSARDLMLYLRKDDGDN